MPLRVNWALSAAFLLAAFGVLARSPEPAPSRLRAARTPAPRPAPPKLHARKSRIAVVSDLNGSYGSKGYGSAVHAAVRALSEDLRPDIVLVTGDMVAGQRRGLDYAGMWHAFHGAVTKPLARVNIPLAPSPGNHDASPSFQSERREYGRTWSQPEVRPNLSFVDESRFPFRYSFTLADVFFVALDAAAVGPLPEEQRTWLDAQLLQAPAGAAKVVFGHLPLHPVARGREHETLDDPRLELVLERHGVDVFISGHHHAYYPGRTQRIRHFAMPCLGAGPRSLVGQNAVSLQALGLIEFENGKLVTLDALPAPQFLAPIARSELPSSIALGRHLLVRDDLPWPVARPSLASAGTTP